MASKVMLCSEIKKGKWQGMGYKGKGGDLTIKVLCSGWTIDNCKRLLLILAMKGWHWICELESKCLGTRPRFEEKRS